MELEEKLTREALDLANQISAMNKKSDEYEVLMDRYQVIMRMLSEETKRINAQQEMQLQAEKLAFEKDRAELESAQKKTEAELKERELAQERELQEQKLQMEQSKIELEGMQERLKADIEERKIDQQKKSKWWEVGLKILGGVVTVGANLASVYCMIRFNNSGETLTSFENKFIFPAKLDR